MKKENNPDNSKGYFAQLLKQDFSAAFRNLLIVSLIMILIWEALLFFLPSGWWIMAINILFFLGSFFLFYFSSQFLKMILPTWLAFLCGFLIWGFIVILIRSLIGIILEALFL